MISSSISSLLPVMAVALLLLQHDGFMVASFSNTVASPNRISSISTTTTATATATTTHLRMISFGGGDKDGKEEELPRDVKQAVKLCRQATQTALQNRLSRMDIEFPVGTDFGVEAKSKPKGGRKRRQQQAAMDNDSDDGRGGGAPTQSTLDRSDRELARLFVEMFQPVGGDKIVVSFVDNELAEVAKQSWKNDAGATCRVLAMNRRPGGGNPRAKKKKRKKVLTSARGFAAKLAADLDDDDNTDNGDGKNDSTSGRGPFKLPENTEVALFVTPGPKELIVIEKICETVGMGTLVVLLNARLDKIQNFGTDATEQLFKEDFEPVFSLGAAPQDQAPNCLLYRAYPEDWVLARKPSVGRPKTILSQSEKPIPQECQQAFDELEITDLEKNVEGFVDNVAGWFR